MHPSTKRAETGGFHGALESSSLAHLTSSRPVRETVSEKGRQQLKSIIGVRPLAFAHMHVVICVHKSSHMRICTHMKMLAHISIQ